MEGKAGGQSPAPSGWRSGIWGALTLLVLLGLVAGQLGTTRAIFDSTVDNNGSTFGTTAIYSPTGLASASANCSGTCYSLSWTPPSSNNGNGYAISGVNNGTGSTCPASGAAYTTFVGSTTSASFIDSGPIAQGRQGTYACYLVRSGYNPSGAPPWSGLPTWSNQTNLATVAVRLGIYEIQAGTPLQSAGGNVTPTLNAASTTGNLLTFVGWNNSCSTCGFSGPAGWSRATRVNTSIGWDEIWYYPFNAGGITSATFTTTGSSSYGQLTEWSGIYGTSPLDQTATTTGSSVTSLTISTSSPTTVTGELAITSFDNTGGGTYGASPNGWTNIFTDNTNAALSDYQLTGSPATISETMTYSKKTTWHGLIATFKATNYAIQNVQVGTNVASSGSGNVTATLPAASTAGNLLVFTGWNSSCSTCGFSGPAGWVRAQRRFNPWWAEIWYNPSNPGGITNATFTSSGTGSGGQLSEFKGVSTLDAIGAFNTTSNVTSATVTTTAATTQIGELAVTYFENNGGGTFGTPSGWIHLVNDGTNGELSDYMIIGSTATVSEKVTSTISSPMVAVIATFK
jgi:hypothetical protein